MVKIPIVQDGPDGELVIPDWWNSFCLHFHRHSEWDEYLRAMGIREEVDGDGYIAAFIFENEKNAALFLLRWS